MKITTDITIQEIKAILRFANDNYSEEDCVGRITEDRMVAKRVCRKVVECWEGPLIERLKEKHAKS